MDRSQQMLLPPDMAAWVPDDHEVWFVLALVDGLDLSVFEAEYRLGGRGREAFSPAVMVALLIYAYARGLRASRRIERACWEDVAFRVICGVGGEIPDHVTICRFRQRHEDAFARLFEQVLLACDRLGMLPLGHVAIDGTKLQADAALDANRRVSWVRDEVRRMLDEADAADAADDGDGSGGSGVGDEERLARLQEALAYAERELAGEDDRVNVTDPESRAVHSGGGFLQGYNAQAVVGEGQVVLAGLVTNHINDYGLLSVMLDELRATLAAAGIDRAPAVALADAGYLSADDLAGIDGIELLVATGKTADLPALGDVVEVDPEPASREERKQAEQQRRAAVVERVEAGELTYEAAAAELALSIQPVWQNHQQWRAGGVSAISCRVPADRMTRAQRLRLRMRNKLSDETNRALYKQRGPLVEGFFAATKHQRNGRWFTRRGLKAANAEFVFGATVHNVFKIRTAITNALNICGAGTAPAIG